MRKTLSVLCLILMLGLTMPAQAQLRQDVHTQAAPARLYDQGGATFSLNKYFSPEHFRMSHTVEMSSGSFGSLGMYTNSMMWQFSQKLAARVDLSVGYSPSGNAFGNNDRLNQGDNTRFFLRNAELAFRPNEKSLLHLSVRQSPYGAYASPYGYGYGYQPYGYGHSASFQAMFGHDQRDLFWNDRLR
jgi:hypothetical protein